jgi:hypothetical protein
MTLSKDQALAILRSGDCEESCSNRWWPCRLGRVSFVFPNWSWRQRAIRAHDLHHLMTGYPMTMRGEFQMAAWEFGGGRYPHWGATVFCLPLIVAGMLWSPRKMAEAFRAGRKTGTLYSATQPVVRPTESAGR